MTKMTTEEAFIKVLQMHGIEHAFGIIGSAFMPISDLFPKAGITFWDVAHETNGGLIADGYTRSNFSLMCIIVSIFRIFIYFVFYFDFPSINLILYQSGMTILLFPLIFVILLSLSSFFSKISSYKSLIK